MPQNRTDARIGNLVFRDRFADPVVDVETEADTVEKTTVNEEIVVQRLGRLADRITIDGAITADQTGTLDNLVADGEITVRTERWSGLAFVLQASTEYTHSYDSVYVDDDDINEWLYEVRIDCIEVDRAPGTPVGGGGGSGEFVTVSE